VNEGLNRTAANRIALNWTTRSKTKACITKLCENCTLLRY